ncbi:hypothetical protein R5W24_002442 [Gemmata sp. JC717]|uniref:hypothetical protein n=1 Tax=Gemmata algarum TaxID=2975278 RepID=UPI0021BB137F|nr:hypothetical protein [Gemmata algarum]MDY3553341.1 hypothetical protein [Gemmata algarum]
MAQTYTLEEAAGRLGLTTAEMKKKLQTDPDFKKLSQIRDGSTVRFKVTAIEELSRQLGMASEDALPMAPLDDSEPGSEDFKVTGLEDKKKPAKKPAADEIALDFGTSDDEVFSLTDEPAPTKPKSSGKLTPGKAPRAMSDSSSGSDSDVRLDGGKPKKPKGADEAAVPTEELALDFSGPGSAVIKGGSSAKLSAPKTGGASDRLDPSKGNKADDSNDSSEFELSLDADSDDFDLPIAPEAGDEVDLGSMPKAGGPARSSPSGINLSSPADSGISLEKGKPGEKSKARKAADSDESDLDFELSLDSSAVSSSTKLGAPQSGKLVLDSDSDSEFELTLDDSGGSLEQAALDGAAQGEDKGDIFETDFEIPAMPDESGSEAVALESDTDLEKSDFELAMDDSDVAAEEDSGSEVVLLDEEEAEAKPRPKAKPAPAAKGKKRPVADDADVDLSDEIAVDEDDASASKALKGAKSRRRGDDEDEEDEVVPAGAGAQTAQWGVVPVLFLAPALLFTLVGALMGYELLQTMWGYQQPRKPTAPIVRGIASQLDMELKDQ